MFTKWSSISSSKKNLPAKYLEATVEKNKKKPFVAQYMHGSNGFFVSSTSPRRQTRLLLLHTFNQWFAPFVISHVCIELESKSFKSGTYKKKKM
jgi:hypothetical protein